MLFFQRTRSLQDSQRQQDQTFKKFKEPYTLARIPNQVAKRGYFGLRLNRDQAQMDEYIRQFTHYGIILVSCPCYIHLRL